MGYIERMHMFWKEKGMFDGKEQRLLDQKWEIVRKRWFSDLELNQVKEKSLGVTEESDENCCEGFVEFGKEDMLCVKISMTLIGGRYLFKSRPVQ